MEGTEAPRVDARDMICIACPVGCRLTVYRDGEGGAVRVEGNSCPRGLTYGRQEYAAPMRMVTTTVQLEGGAFARLPVKTAAPVPKERIDDVLAEVREVHATAPVRVGQVVKANAAGTGVDVVATRTA